jgi:hypothetical protein
MSNYSLEVISHHPTFKNKSLRKYYVDGIDTIGAWGDEPFEIVFKNNTWQKVQVKLSLDGTDILTGEPANTEVSDKMWVVNGYGTLSLKAWPETNNGGAHFVFTSANNSVAVHTHGDLSSRGIIAAAVFTEGHVEPLRTNHNHYHYNWPTYNPIWIGGNYGSSGGGILRGGNTIISNTSTFGSGTLSANSVSVSASNAADSGSASAAYFSAESKALESLAAVGAGQYVDQKISYTSGLIKPLLSETVRLRYMWWDDLVSKLRANHVPVPHASGFPGDHNKQNINLGGTPRIGQFSQPAFPRPEPKPEPFPSYLRV